MSKQKLFAIFHDGTFDGDSAFYCPDDSMPYSGENLRDLKKKFHEKKLKEDWPELSKADKESRDSAMQDIKEDWPIDGAWIVDTKTIKAIQAIWDEVDPGNDSATYACNRAAKAVANALAIKKLGKKPK
jgi:hypothetical protein